MATDKYAEGNLIYTYMGHGGYNRWSWPEETWQYSFYFSNINQPGFDNRLPLVFSIACNTGSFHNNDNCMAEKFLAYNNIRGCIGFIGASEPSSWKDNDGFAPYLFEASFRYGLGMCGEMLLEAKIKTPRVGTINQINLFGDPALNILLDIVNINECDLICNR